MRVDRGTISSSISNHLIHSTFEVAMAKAQYSDLVLDLKTATCFLEHKETKFRPKETQYPNN